MQPIHWSFLFYGLSSNWNRRKIKLSNIFNQEIIKWWWINWLSSSLCVYLWGVQQIQSLLVSLFPCFECDVFHWVLHKWRSDLCAVVLQSLTAACILAINWVSAFIVQSCECVWENELGGFIFTARFLLFPFFWVVSMNWINPAGQSEICVCGNCFTAVLCTGSPALR